MLTDEAQGTWASLPVGIDLSNLASWCDDSAKPYATYSEARQAGAAIIWLSWRYGFVLKPSKFEGPSRDSNFGGFDFKAPDKVSWMPKKADKAEKIVATLLLAGEASLDQLSSIIGKLVNFSMVYPAAKPFLAGLYEAQIALTQRVEHRQTSKTSLHPLSERALTCLRFWAHACRIRPSTAVGLLCRPQRDCLNADVIIHTDWGREGGVHRHGVALLSHGKWMSSVCLPEMVTRAFRTSDVSSPYLEGCALPLTLATFPDIVRRRRVIFFVDNAPFLQQFYKFNSARDVNPLFQAISLLSLHLECVVHVWFVPTGANLSDPLSRGMPQLFKARMSAASLSFEPSPTEPASPTALLSRAGVQISY